MSAEPPEENFSGGFFVPEIGGDMDLARQRLSNASGNADSNPPYYNVSPFHKGGLKGIWPSFLIVAIFVAIFSGITNPAYSGQAVLTWTPPTTNADGTPLTDLAGYKVYYGTASGNYSTVIDAANVTSYTVPN